MSRQAPESSLDHYAASLQSGMFALRGYMLHDRAKAASNDRRRGMLRALGGAYVARGMAIEHRLAGSTATAMRLETQSEDLLAEARRICRETD